MDRKNSSALGGSREKHWLVETIRHIFKKSEMSNQGIKNNGVNEIGTTSWEGFAPGIHAVPDPALAGRHQAPDETKERMN